MKLTIGICAYNEEKNIGQLLDNILYKQNLSLESSILVVCSGCTDNTVEIVKTRSKSNKRIKIIVEDQRLGKTSAVNKILKHSDGDYILFISADTVPHRKCFSRLISVLNDPRVGLVSARPMPINETNSVIGEVVNILWDLHDCLFKILDEKGFVRHASEAFCVRKNIVKELPKTTVNDDSYIAIAALKKGWLLKYDPSSRVSICGPQNLIDYINQRRRVIYGHYQGRKLTGQSPQYFSSMTNGLNFALKTIMRLIKNYRLRSVIIFFYLELMLNFIAMFDFISNKSYSKWDIAKSTKNVKS